MQTSKVSWTTYAQQYDMLMQYNPFYQQLHDLVFGLIDKWNAPPEAVIADIGAGTGNYSMELARRFPQARILHVDKDAGMNAVASHKMRARGLQNIEIREMGIEQADIPANSLSYLISIHALYAFPSPERVLQQMYTWLKPGGEALLVDAGRIVNVWAWQWVLGRHFLKTYGLTKTLKIFREGREVSRQNAYIRRMQRRGQFWTHSHEEFIEAVRDAGFTVPESGITFRGVSDWVVARKPK